MSKKIGRNDPCPCGSGKKFKKCCMKERRISRMKQCNKCEYWKPTQQLPREVGECHLNPPTVMPGMQAPIAAWPVTNADDFCRGFEQSAKSAMRIPSQAPPQAPQIRAGRITRPVDPLMRPSERADEVVENAQG